MKKRFFTFLFMLVALFSTVLHAETTVIVAQGADAKTLDPAASNDVPSHRVTLQIYDNLVAREGTKLVPGLAESWTQVDPLTLDLKIRKGVKFHNGDPLTVNDVVFSLIKVKNDPSMMSFFVDVDKVEAIDDETVRITTKKPFGPLVGYLAHYGAGILSEKAVTEAGKSYGQHPVGTGPFKFESWASGDRIVLKANPDYYQGKPAIDTLIFRTIPEGTNRTIALETKEVDIAVDIEAMDHDMVRNHPDLKLLQKPALTMNYVGFNTTKPPFDKKEVRQAIAYAIDLHDMVRNHPDLKLLQKPALTMNYVGFNTTKPPFDKKEVRQAIAYAIDLQSMVDAIYLGAATPASSPVAPAVFGHNKDLKVRKQDIAKAKELLAQAGYPNGFKAKIWTNNNNVRKDTAVILQDQLKQIGIDVEIELLEWGAYLDRLANREHDMFLLGWTPSPDGDSAMYAVFHSKNHGSAGNRMWYTNARVDECLDKGRESTVPEEREAAYKEAQAIIMDEVPLIPLVWPDNNAGIQKNIKGFELDLENQHKLYPVSKE